MRHLERHGHVQVKTDPADQRARQVSPTSRGREAIAAGRQVVTDFDRCSDAAPRTDRASRLRVDLARIVGTGPTDR